MLDAVHYMNLQSPNGDVMTPSEVGKRLAINLHEQGLLGQALDVTRVRAGMLISGFVITFFMTAYELGHRNIFDMIWLTKYDFQRQNIQMWADTYKEKMAKCNS